MYFPKGSSAFQITGFDDLSTKPNATVKVTVEKCKVSIYYFLIIL